MNKFVKKTCVILLLSTVLVLLPEEFFVGHASTETDLSKEVLVFLRDVVKVDLTKYNATLVVGPFTENPSWLGGLTQVYGKYNLTSETSWVEVLYDFVNGTIASCGARVRVGQLQLSESPPASLRDAVDVFLQRYQAYTHDSSVQAMRAIVQNTDLSKSRTITTTSNLKLDVTVDSSTSAFFDWHNTIDGAAYSGLNVGFDNGVFNGFVDDRSYMKASGAHVVVSQDQAVNIALACAANFTYSYGGKDITGFDIVKDQIRSGLLTKGRDNILVWYPYWDVILPLSDYYPGSVSCIVVEIWADTSEVISVYPTGSDVGSSADPTIAPSTTLAPSSFPSIPSPSSSTSSPAASPLPSSQPTASPSPQLTQMASPTLQPSQSATAQPTDSSKLTDQTVQVAVVAAVIAVSVAAAAFLVKRKPKRQ